MFGQLVEVEFACQPVRPTARFSRRRVCRTPYFDREKQLTVELRRSAGSAG